MTRWQNSLNGYFLFRTSLVKRSLNHSSQFSRISAVMLMLYGYLYSTSHRGYSAALSAWQAGEKKPSNYTETQVISSVTSHSGKQEECHSRGQNPLQQRPSCSESSGFFVISRFTHTFFSLQPTYIALIIVGIYTTHKDRLTRNL